MSSLKPTEIVLLERLFEMSSGYVLDFTNNTFSDFVVQSIGVEPYSDPRYEGSGSKANILRSLWRTENDLVVAKLLGDLLSLVPEIRDCQTASRRALLEKCNAAVARLRSGLPAEALLAVAATEEDPNLDVLAQEVRVAIEKGEPALGLDRLHAFATRYVRKLAERRGITIDRSKPLHGIYGEYLKSLNASGIAHTEMTRRILRSSLSVLDSFNEIRNNKSFAHDNEVLEKEEALLVCSHVIAILRFLGIIDQKRTGGFGQLEPSQEADSVPF